MDSVVSSPTQPKAAVLSPREARLRKRCARDFPFYAAVNLKIRTASGEVKPFILNRAQRFFYDKFIEQERRMGMVRLITLKGRQQGISTEVEGIGYHRATHRRGYRVSILAHLDEATNNLFDMVKRFHSHCNLLLKPHTKHSNSKELVFDRLDSSYALSTAGSKETGRSNTIQFFHGSEVAFWPNAESIARGIGNCLHALPGTVSILESTSNGPDGYFYEQCMKALHGESRYELVFMPWFWQEEYRSELPEDFELTTSDEDYRELVKEKWGEVLDDEQLAWRRYKISELSGVWNFRREFPISVEEAFEAEVEGALWLRHEIEAARRKAPIDLGRIVIAVDPAGSHKKESDETGICVAGRDSEGHAYVLSDLSANLSPQEWGQRVVDAYYKWGADKIVAEVNYGGDMVKEVIRGIDPAASRNVKMVHASRGKHVRAEPVASEAKAGKIHHCGRFERLENQLVLFTNMGWQGERSPDRADAYVWAMHELIVQRREAPEYRIRRL